MSPTDAQKFTFFLHRIGRTDQDQSWPPKIEAVDLDNHAEFGVDAAVMPCEDLNSLLDDINRLSPQTVSREDLRISSYRDRSDAAIMCSVEHVDASVSVGYYEGSSELSWYYFKNQEMANTFIDEKQSIWRRGC